MFQGKVELFKGLYAEEWVKEQSKHLQILEKERKELLTDKFSIYFFELRKLKKSSKGKAVEDWLNLINAEKKEDLMALEMSTKIPEVKDVIVKVRELSADEKLRREAFYREKRLHDEANAINGSRREGIKIGRAEGLAEGEKIGMTNAIINNIKSLMETLNITAEKPMNALKLPQEEQNFYLSKLEPIS